MLRWAGIPPTGSFTPTKELGKSTRVELTNTLDYYNTEVIMICDNKVDSLSNIICQCLASSVYSERLATIIIGNGKQ
jgi:hypothetical protein